MSYYMCVTCNSLPYIYVWNLWYACISNILVYIHSVLDIRFCIASCSTPCLFAFYCNIMICYTVVCDAVLMLCYVMVCHAILHLRITCNILPCKLYVYMLWYACVSNILSYIHTTFNIICCVANCSTPSLDLLDWIRQYDINPTRVCDVVWYYDMLCCVVRCDATAIFCKGL